MRPCLLSLAAFSLTAFAVTFLPPAAAGDLYKWTDEKGLVHYTSTPPPDTAKKAVLRRFLWKLGVISLCSQPKINTK